MVLNDTISFNNEITDTGNLDETASLKPQDFDYALPPHLIAQKPAGKRDESRLLVLDKGKNELFHSTFISISEYLCKGDVLVLNDTKVFPARIFGRKETGGKVEVTFLEPSEAPGPQPALLHCRRGLYSGVRIFLEEGFSLVFHERDALGVAMVSFEGSSDGKGLLWYLGTYGQMPLPPYIKRKSENVMSLLDRERYQTVYASNPGAVAAPTAGLHFTEGLLERLRDSGVEIAFVTLHTGYGSFAPVKTEHVRDFRINSESFNIGEDASNKINKAVDSGRKVIAVGTTSARVIESSSEESGHVKPQSGLTCLFIYPGYEFRVVKGLVTNFHLPRSSLIMLACALAGRERLLQAYKEAISLEYRFFSYGDAMFIF